jgi:hypothetical protein
VGNCVSQVVQIQFLDRLYIFWQNPFTIAIKYPSFSVASFSEEYNIQLKRYQSILIECFYTKPHNLEKIAIHAASGC